MSEQVMQQILQEMRHGFHVVNTRLDRVEQRLEHVEQRLEHVEQRLEHVEQRLEHVEQRLEHVETTVGALKQAVLETHETVVRMDEIQRQHATAIQTLESGPAENRRMLEALTIKYMEHDADIRELKRAR